MIKLFLILFMFTFSISAQGVSTKLAKVQEWFRQTESFSSDFSYRQSDIQNRAFEIRGVLKYKRGDKFAIDSESLQLVSNGESTWNYNKRLDRVVISSASANSAFKISQFILEFPEKCTVSTSLISSMTSIELTPRNQNKNIETIKLIVDSKDQIKIIIVKDQTGIEYLLEFNNIKTSITFDDSEFVYTPSQNTEIVDLR